MNGMNIEHDKLNALTEWIGPKMKEMSSDAQEAFHSLMNNSHKKMTKEPYCEEPVMLSAYRGASSETEMKSVCDFAEKMGKPISFKYGYEDIARISYPRDNQFNSLNWNNIKPDKDRTKVEFYRRSPTGIVTVGTFKEGLPGKFPIHTPGGRNFTSYSTFKNGGGNIKYTVTLMYDGKPAEIGDVFNI